MERLAQLSSDGRALPKLADSWTWDNDGLALHVNLRKGITFHDGTPLAAKVVSEILLKAIAKPSNRALYTSFHDIADVHATGDLDARIRIGHFDAFLIESVWGPSLSRAYMFWASARRFQGLNVFGYENPQAAERLFGVLRTTTNEGAIRSATRNLQQVLLDDPPALFLTWNRRSRAVRRDFEIVQDATPDPADPMYTIWKWNRVTSDLESKPSPFQSRCNSSSGSPSRSRCWRCSSPAIYWGRSFINPILALTRGTRALASGNLDERVVVDSTDELGQLGEAFNNMADKLVQLQEDVRKKERQAMFGRIAVGLVLDLSHPIQNIGNSCELIVKMWDDLEYRESFRRTVERELAQVKRVLDDLRNLARPLPLDSFRWI